MAQSNLSSLSRKRNREEDVEDDDWTNAKRQAREIVRTFTSSTFSQKRQFDEIDEIDGAPSAKRQELENATLPGIHPISSRKSSEDDVGGTEDTQGNQQVQTAIEVKVRMSLYTILQSCKTWKDCCDILNMVPVRDSTLMAYLINDLPQWARFKALNQLESNEAVYQGIVAGLATIQIDKSRYDPKSLFPCVATDQFLNGLPQIARVCNVCGKGYEVGASMIWKSCGKHSLHEDCLRARLSELDLPLIGDCSCVGSF